MNTSDVMKNGHQSVLDAVQDLPNTGWEVPGVCGSWTVKEIIAHLASFEQVLVEVLASFLQDGPTPMLDRLLADDEGFNAREVARRQADTPASVLAEYRVAHAQAMRYLDRIPLEMRQQNGTLAWYGNEYDLDDLIVYMFYGHKREHCAQIAAFRAQWERMSQPAPVQDGGQPASGG